MNIASLIQSIAVIFWVVTILVVVLVVIRASRNNPLHNATGIVIGMVVLAVIMSTVASGLVFVDPQSRGIVISAFSPGGYRQEILQPGIRWIVPFAESVVTYPISRQTYTMSVASSEGQVQGDDSIAARTLDGQEVFIDASVMYQVDPTKITQVHIQWQTRYGDELVRPQSRGIIRDVVSQYRVEEVVSTKRAIITSQIREAMTKKLDENGLQLVDFVLRNITFSKEYAASIEQKQIAEQLAQQAKFVVEQKKQEAEQARQTAQGAADAVVIRAKGDAESRLISAEAEAKSLDLIATALKGKPELLTYQYITKLSPNISAMLLPANAPFLFPLPEMQTVTQPTPAPTPAP